MNVQSRNVAANALRPQSIRKKLRGWTAFGSAVAGLVLCTAISAAFAAPLLPVPVTTVPSNGDTNPYGVLFVSGYPGGTLQQGDVLVSNFNNSVPTMFLGTTIVD